MTYSHVERVPVIRSVGALAEQIVYRKLAFEFKDLGMVPRSVLNLKADRTTLMWNVLKWGLPAEDFAHLDGMPMSAIREQLAWWEERSGVKLLDIMGALNTITTHKTEAEYDMIALGLRLRDCPSERFTWGDLVAIIKHSDTHSRLYAATLPDGAHWDTTNMLLADAVDALRWLRWAKTKAAHDHPDDCPDPIMRPGVKEAEEEAQQVQAANGAVMPTVKHKMTLSRAKEVFAKEDDPQHAAKLYKLFRSA